MMPAALGSIFTLSSTASNGINPLIEAVTLQVGTFTTTIPPGSLTEQPDGSFTFAGVIDGVSLSALIKPAGTLRYGILATATGRQFDRDQERGVCDPDHRRRQRRDLRHGRDFPLKTRDLPPIARTGLALSGE